MDEPHPSHLKPSQLGTKEYWDAIYTQDLTNHSTDPSSIGEIWFSDSNAESNILTFLTSPESSKLDLNLDPSTNSFLDLGTGNGSLLFLLREKGGFEGRMVGVDYSRPSVDLAREVGREKGLIGTRTSDSGGSGSGSKKKKREVEFYEWDLFAEESPPAWMDEDITITITNGSEGDGRRRRGFDVVLDKGTFDAISLSEEVESRTGRRLCDGYRARVEALVKEGGYLLVTSCNWTEEELIKWFVGGDSGFEVFGRIQYPVFSFGGKTGQKISSVCFKLKSSIC